MAHGVSGIVHDDELTAGPGLPELRRDVERTADVETAVDQYARDPRESVSVAQQDAVLEESRMAPVVRDQSREAHPKQRVLVAGVRPMVRANGNVRVLPVTPVACGLLAHGRVAAVEQLTICLDKPALTAGV